MTFPNRVLKPLAIVGIPVFLLSAMLASVSAPRNQPDRQADGVEVTATQPEFRAYVCEPPRVAALAAELERKFGTHPHTRIVPDQRRAQILVIAPPDIQADISRCLSAEVSPPEGKEKTAGPRLPGPVTNTPPVNAVSVGGQEVQLWQTSAKQMEASLVRGLGIGGRLAPLSNASANQSAYLFRLPNGSSLRLTVDQRSNRVRIEGAAPAVESATQLVHALDHPPQLAGPQIELVALSQARAADVQPMVQALQSRQQDTGTRIEGAPLAGQPAIPPSPSGSLAAPMASERGAAIPPAESSPGGSQTTRIVPLPGDVGAGRPGEQYGLLGPVQIEILEGLDVLVIRGDERDVKRVVEILEQIESLAAEAELSIRVVMLRHVDSVALATLLQQVYAESFETRLGSVSITALGKPNAVLLVGREETIKTVLDLIARLDLPVPPAAQFQVFRLKRLPAETAQESIEAFFAQQAQQAGPQQGQQQGLEPGSLSPRVRVVADFRSNSLIVRGSPRDLAEVAALLEQIDSEKSEAVNEVRVFKLKNTLAETLAPVLRDAITGQIYGQRAERGPAVARPTTGAREDFEPKSSRLQFVTVDPRGRRVLQSGILTDAQVTADSRTNSLIITASADSMPLIGALIQELDQPPEIEAQVKVFTLVNSDAEAMTDMLQSIFGTAGAAEGIAVRTGTPLEETTLVGLRFAVDVRSNSIIVTGSSGALTVVEAILLRLDETDVRSRRTAVYRLKNAPANDVANAVNQYLSSKRQAEQIVPGLLSAVEQIEREVVIVSEPVSNSLIVSATPRFFDEITKLVEDLDERPPMVMIQVLIAEVTLSDVDEFGVELGLQDSILFDRSAILGAGNEGLLSPGFLFNTASLGNSARAESLATREKAGGQAITSLDVGRTNSELGFGGLVLSASSESISVLIRALKQHQRLQVLSRPQVMTMDNQSALIHVGQDVPTIQASEVTQFGVINSIEYRQVGLILTVTPRISPDRLVVMELQAEKSEVGPLTEGIPVAVTEGEVVRSPRINITTTSTVVSAMDGQTVVLGGLITTSDTNLSRRVPYLSDVPVLGNLFQYKRDDKRRTELLIIMTPRIVERTEDAEAIKRVEAARMHWCLCDVMALHEGDGLSKNGPAWYDGDAAVIYPDLDPTLNTMQELAVPGEDAADSPVTPETIPAPQSIPLPESGWAPGAAFPPQGLPPGTVPSGGLPQSPPIPPGGSPPAGNLNLPPSSEPATATPPGPGAANATGPAMLRPAVGDPATQAATHWPRSFEPPQAWAQRTEPAASAGNRSGNVGVVPVHANAPARRQSTADRQQSGWYPGQ